MTIKMEINNGSVKPSSVKSLFKLSINNCNLHTKKRRGRWRSRSQQNVGLYFTILLNSVKDFEVGLPIDLRGCYSKGLKELQVMTISGNASLTKGWKAVSHLTSQQYRVILKDIYYIYTYIIYSWEDAKKLCHELNMSLPIVHSSEENLFLAQYAVQEIRNLSNSRFRTKLKNSRHEIQTSFQSSYDHHKSSTFFAIFIHLKKVLQYIVFKSNAMG